ncbi:unnamed protein product [marine sediment metagenome]|uniref:Uncharacterized protein n=1 Tax=marine sediment metagenome TaxID=412755 RepID=X0VSE2_9ZZZZ
MGGEKGDKKADDNKKRANRHSGDTWIAAQLETGIIFVFYSVECEIVRFKETGVKFWDLFKEPGDAVFNLFYVFECPEAHSAFR